MPSPVIPPIDLVEKLRMSERLATKIIGECQLHAEPPDLRMALGSSGSTTRAVLKNWLFELIDSRPELFCDPEAAKQFATRKLRDRLLETFPGSCEP